MSGPWNESSEYSNKTDLTDDPNIPVFVTYIIICACGLIGNGIVIFTITRYARLKTVTNIYICNLAFADFLFSADLALIAVTVWLQYWAFGNVMCKVNFAIYSCTMFESIFTLVPLSIERYVTVCRPLKSLGNKKVTRALVVVVITWILCFGCALPAILYARADPHWKKEGKQSCVLNWSDNGLIDGMRTYTVYSFLFGFAVPMLIITVFYSLLVKGLRSNVILNSQHSAERQKSQRKVARMVLVIITVYIVCWLPHWIFQLLLAFEQLPQGPHRIRISLFTTSLSFINSMLNPFLYAFLSSNFRKSFKQACICFE